MARPGMRLAALQALGAGACLLLGAAGCSRDGDAFAERLHRASIVVDTHSDTTALLLDPEWRFEERHDTGHVDLPRAREGGLDVMFWSIYVGERSQRGQALGEALEEIDAVHELVRRLPDDLALAGSVAEIRRAVSSGRIACVLGMEGGHMIEDRLDLLRTYQRLGVRYLTLTHSFHTSWADSAGINEPLAPLHGGLTPFGEQVVLELNRLGMLVDVSHVSDDTFWDALRVSRAPLLASHSATRALADHPRNLSDEMLRALAEKGGVVMINFYSGYLDPELMAPLRALMLRIGPGIAAIRESHPDDPLAQRRAIRALFQGQQVPRTKLDVLFDHFDHAIQVAGPDHVGIGADWDGVVSMPEGMEDVSRLGALTRGLLARGHAPEVVRQVLGENLLRLLGDAEAVAASLAREEAAARAHPAPAG